MLGVGMSERDGQPDDEDVCTQDQEGRRTSPMIVRRPCARRFAMISQVGWVNGGGKEGDRQGELVRPSGGSEPGLVTRSPSVLAQYLVSVSDIDGKRLRIV